jgi:hypothetical protein
LGETSTGFFLKPSTPYTSEALKKKNVRKYLEGAAGDQAVFVVQLSILNRMSLLAGFVGLGRPTALTVLASSLRLKYSWPRSAISFPPFRPILSNPNPSVR